MNQLDTSTTSGEAEHGEGLEPDSGSAGNGTSVAVLVTEQAAGTSRSGVSSSGVSSRNSLLMGPAASSGEHEVVSTLAGRKVGFQYSLQQLLTSGPMVLADLTLLVGVFVAARQLIWFFGGVVGMDLTDCALPIATGFLLISAELGLYPGIRLSPVEEFRRMSMATTSIFAVWVMSLLITSNGLSWQRGLFLAVAYGMYLVCLPICRGGMRRLLARTKWWGFPTLVCGNNPATINVYEWLTSNRRLGLRPVGLISTCDQTSSQDDISAKAAPWTETGSVANKLGAYWAVVVPSEDCPTALDASIAEHLSTIPHIHILSDLEDISNGWARHQQFEGLSGVQIQQNLMLPFPRFTKRCMDLVVAITGGILLLPLLFYIAVAVKMSSRGPILYGHNRIGKDGKPFKAWKFRTMFQDASQVLEIYLEAHPDLKDEWERDQKLRRDPRVTRIGRFIRKTSLDELQHIWNVIRGEMSLVGPRPIVTSEIAKYGPYYGLYAMVTPGITGVWQVSGRNNTTYDERVQLDAYYVRNWSPWMDLYLLIRTIRIVLFADGAY
jgi:Undecaprenyl-phosphate galactose phosphotransferase WbaP